MGKSLDEVIFRWPRVLEEIEEARVTGNLSYFDRSVYWRIQCRLKECMDGQRWMTSPDILAQRDSVREIRRALATAYVTIMDQCLDMDDIDATADIRTELGDEMDMIDAWLDLVDTYCIGELGWATLNRFIRSYSHGEDA